MLPSSGLHYRPHSLANRTHPQSTQPLTPLRHSWEDLDTQEGIQGPYSSVCGTPPWFYFCKKRSLLLPFRPFCNTARRQLQNAGPAAVTHIVAWSVTTSWLFLIGDYYSDFFEGIERKRYLGCEAGRRARCSLRFQCVEVWVLVLSVGRAVSGRGREWEEL